MRKRREPSDEDKLRAEEKAKWLVRMEAAREADARLNATEDGPVPTTEPLCPRCLERVTWEDGCFCTKYGNPYPGWPRLHLPW